MNPIELLRAQHREVEALFLRTDAARGEERWDLFHELAHALLLHGQLEEDAFYPEVRTAETEELVAASFDEHGEVKKLIGRLADTAPDSREFQALLVELKASVDAHVAEEQNVLFPAVEAGFSVDQIAEIGERVAQRKAELEQPDELPAYDQPAPLR